MSESVFDRMIESTETTIDATDSSRQSSAEEGQRSTAQDATSKRGALDLAIRRIETNTEPGALERGMRRREAQDSTQSGSTKKEALERGLRRVDADRQNPLTREATSRGNETGQSRMEADPDYARIAFYGGNTDVAAERYLDRELQAFISEVADEPDESRRTFDETGVLETWQALGGPEVATLRQAWEAWHGQTFNREIIGHELGFGPGHRGRSPAETLAITKELARRQGLSSLRRVPSADSATKKGALRAAAARVERIKART